LRRAKRLSDSEDSQELAKLFMNFIKARNGNQQLSSTDIQLFSKNKEITQRKKWFKKKKK